MSDTVAGRPSDRCESLSVNTDAALAYGRSAARCAGTPRLVSATLRFTALFDAPNGPLPRALTADGTLHELGTEPRVAARGVRFRQVTQRGHTCGVGLTGVGYCWGANDFGELGVGTAQALGPWPDTPGAVAADLTWEELDAGFHSTCGLATGGRAYCWGLNRDFRLGIGPDASVGPGCGVTPCAARPTAVQTEARFVAIASGDAIASGYDTCGLENDGTVRCWGDYRWGLWPGRSEPKALAGIPARVAGAPRFVALRSGAYPCGITAAGAAACLTRDPEAPTVETLYAFAPVALPFAVREFRSSSFGGCALRADDGRAYCWGNYPETGRLGDGAFRAAPVERPALVAGQGGP